MKSGLPGQPTPATQKGMSKENLRDRIYDSTEKPCDLAAEAIGVKPATRKRRAWNKACRILGRRTFLTELLDLMGDLEMGVDFRDAAAVFQARLNKLMMGVCR